MGCKSTEIARNINYLVIRSLMNLQLNINSKNVTEPWKMECQGRPTEINDN